MKNEFQSKYFWFVSRWLIGPVVQAVVLPGDETGHPEGTGRDGTRAELSRARPCLVTCSLALQVDFWEEKWFSRLLT